MARIQKYLIGKLICSFFALFLFVSCSGQIPSDRPYCENKSFDSKVARTIGFTVPLIGVDELAENQSDYILLDARELSEYEVSHIPGAKFIGYDNFDLNTLKDIPKDSPIVIYCSIGYRSEKIGEQLLNEGFINVKNLYGSLFEWVNSGNQVVDNQGVVTKKVHTYNRVWSKWVFEPTVKKTW